MASHAHRGTGVDLQVHRTGGGRPPVVLAHGITDSGLCWTRLARALQPDYDVVMIDARGHGGSDHPGSYSYGEHVGDLIGVLESLDLSPAILIGHSMGGPHVAAVAAARRDLARGLVLVDPHWPLQPQEPSDHGLDAWRAGIAADNARSMDELLDLGRRENPPWADEDLQPWARAKQTVDPAVPDWLHSGHDIDRWRDVVREIRCPALLLTGDPGVDADVTVRADGARQASELCPTLTVRNIPGAGHSIHRDQFADSLATVTRFLRRIIG